jgi:hypothetical protein
MNAVIRSMGDLAHFAPRDARRSNRTELPPGSVTFRGFAPGRALSVRRLGAGFCMPQQEWHGCDALVDPQASPESGDYVIIWFHCNTTGRISSLLKMLEVDSRGRWYGVCLEGVFPLGVCNDNGQCEHFPAAVERVVARVPSAFPLLPPQPASNGASLQGIDEADELTREARAEWTKSGKRRGVVFPGCPAVCGHPEFASMAEMCPELALPAGHLDSFPVVTGAVLPVSNPTTPTEPALSVDNVVAGTLRFTLADPVVRPVGTRFQIIQSAVSTDAAAGTVVYDGLTQVIDLPVLQVQRFYFGRAYCNSFFSAFSPNTHGLAGASFGTDVFQTNLVVAQTFSKGPGIFLGQELARVDYEPAFADAKVSVTATFRAGRGNIFGTNAVYLRYLTGVTSIYIASSSMPNGGSTTDPLPTALTGVFSYTAGNSAAVQLLWDTTSGANSMVIDRVAIRTEFIRL